MYNRFSISKQNEMQGIIELKGFYYDYIETKWLIHLKLRVAAIETTGISLSVRMYMFNLFTNENKNNN